MSLRHRPGRRQLYSCRYTPLGAGKGLERAPVFRRNIHPVVPPVLHRILPVVPPVLRRILPAVPPVLRRIPPAVPPVLRRILPAVPPVLYSILLAVPQGLPTWSPSSERMGQAVDMGYLP